MASSTLRQRRADDPAIQSDCRNSTQAVAWSSRRSTTCSPVCGRFRNSADATAKHSKGFATHSCPLSRPIHGVGVADGLVGDGASLTVSISMAQLHFIGGEKGGVGKSVVARILAQYFIDRQIPFLGFDTDKSHGSLLRFYADFAAPVAIDQYEGLDRIIEAASEQPARRIIVDLAAQTYRLLTQWMEDSGLLDIRDELGLAITYWHVMDSGRDSAELLAKLLDAYGSRLPLVVVLNEVRGGDFGVVESSGTLARAKTLGAAVVPLRRLQDATMQKIDAHSTSFWAASNRTSKDGSTLGLLERQRVKTWLHRAYDEMGRVNP